MPIPPPDYRNSAGRLLILLKSINSDQPALRSIPTLFGQNGSTQDELQRLSLVDLISIHELYVQFKQDMEEYVPNEKQRQVLLSGVKGVEQIIYPLQLNAVLRQLTDAEKSLLEVCATSLPQDDELLENDLEKIRESIAQLQLDVEGSDVSPTLRKILLELIRLSEDAISRFNIQGARGLKKAFKQMLGEAMDLYGSESASGKKEDLEKSSMWQDIQRHLSTFDSIASRLLKYRPVFEAATPFILEHLGK